MSDYRINVRFRLEDAQQRRVAEFLEDLDRARYGSRNTFAVKAICAYVDEIQQGNPNAKLLEDIRRILREEVPARPAITEETPKTMDVTLTEAQKEQQAVNTLAFLKGF